MSSMLLVGASLLLRSFARLTGVDPGFRPEQVLAFSGRAAASEVSADRPARIAFFDRLLDRLRSMPGVEAAGMVQTVPIRDDYLLSFTIGGGRRRRPARNRRPTIARSAPDTSRRSASRCCAAACSSARRRRRGADGRRDRRGVRAEALPRRGSDRPRLDMGNGTDGFYEIVGIVGSVHHEGLDAAPRPTMYAPFAHDVFGTMRMMVKTKGEPEDFAAAARQAVRDDRQRAAGLRDRTAREVVTESVAQRRFSMLLLAAFAMVALFLAAVGLYGVVAYAVSQRTQEIGLRMAIGAQRGDVLRMVLGGGMKLALVGVVLGIADRVGRRALPEVAAVRGDAVRCVELCRHRRRAARGVRAGLLRPSPTCDGRRSASRAPH